MFVHKYILKISDGMLCYRTNAFSIMYVYVQVHPSYLIHSEFNYFSTCNVKMVVYIIDV